MELKNETYEFGYNEITIEGIKGIAFDICYEGVVGFKSKKPCLIVMTGDGGEGVGHNILGSIEFKDSENLKLVQMALEMIDRALTNEDEVILSEAHKTRTVKSLENYRDACLDAEEEADWKKEAEDTKETIEIIKEL
jgi:hypothetical protein